MREPSFAKPDTNKTTPVADKPKLPQTQISDDKPAVHKAVKSVDNDLYMQTYHQLLHERFGMNIAFKEVLERMGK